MAETRYKLRSDLEIQPEQNAGVIVKDPLTKRFIRFSPEQASALELFDGQTDCASIAAEVTRKHNVEALPEQIEEFAEKLRALLLLDHPYCMDQLERVHEKAPGRLQNLLHLKIYTFNPVKILTFLEKKFRFFFSKSFQYAFGFLAFIAIYISILHWKSLVDSIEKLYSLHNILLILPVVIISLMIHEFAHGIALKHYGGKVEEMGIMLLYFFPALYCNTSDAWMLGKRQRIAVTLAGAYIQIFIWMTATLFWRLLAPDTLFSRICLICILFDGILSLFNLIPLIRLDGYYVLSDYVEIPNLRPKALSYIKHGSLVLLTGSEYAGYKATNRREKHILLLYGTTSCIFTAGLLLYIGYLISSWMVREYKSWGVIMASVLIALHIRLHELRSN